MQPRRPYLALFPVTESRLLFEEEVTVVEYPGLHEVIAAQIGAKAPKKSKDLFRPTVTDRCRETGRGDRPLDQVCTNENSYYHRAARNELAVKGARGNLADASLVTVTRTVIVLKVDPVWVFLPRIDPSHNGVYEFDRLSGMSIEGHRIPDMYLSRIEMYYAGRL